MREIGFGGGIKMRAADEGNECSHRRRPRLDCTAFPSGLRRGRRGTVRGCRDTGARAFCGVEVGGVTVEVEAPVDASNVGKGVSLAADRALAFPVES